MTALTPRLRGVLAGLAGEMIPAGADLPSANDVDMSGSLVDAVLQVRPDLEAMLVSALELLHDVPEGQRLAVLEREPVLMDTMGLVVAGGYLMSPEVASALRYPFQEAKLVRSDDVYEAVSDGLLDGVVDRGPIYRMPPDAPSGLP